ncbi:hypothetical protein BP00DRAFT_456901 [Aspergillus indologenus CBS 114.80]|uniref:Uncharacterized protein n=1 Tax=Aspergillus indologenus CBS 114.80 TaxID=1450541 RepID=A0A2V5I4C4_9EURO|nr:hypothetical protein BP00DRAFT_456901 [Aspergillus indologenus CBS 114.80]
MAGGGPIRALAAIVRGLVVGQKARKTHRVADKGFITTGVDFSQYAVLQYATNQPYICSAVMQLESLTRRDSQADSLLLYPLQHGPASDSAGRRLPFRAQTEPYVKRIPIEVQTGLNGDTVAVVAVSTATSVVTEGATAEVTTAVTMETTET